MKQLKPTVLSVIGAFGKRDQKKLRKINDSLLRTAAMEFSRPLLELTTTTYVLSKIVSKPRFLKKEGEKDVRKIEDALKKVVEAIDSPNEAATVQAFGLVQGAILSMERKDARYMRDLISKGRLKTAATLYAQGLSLGLAAEMTGMDKQDIMDYSGRTMMFDRVKEEKGIMERVRSARRLIGS